MNFFVPISGEVKDEVMLGWNKQYKEMPCIFKCSQNQMLRRNLLVLCRCS